MTITTLEELNVQLCMDTTQDVCCVINSYGAGDHPWCDSKTLPYFAADYVIACITKAIKDGGGSENGRKRLFNALDEIKNKHVARRKTETLQ